LQRRGVKPQACSRIADFAALLVTLFACRQAGAIEDPDNFLSGKPTFGSGKPPRSRQTTESGTTSVTVALFTSDPPKGTTSTEAHFLLVHGKEADDFRFVKDLSAYYRDRWDSDMSVVILIDLERLGQMLAARAGKPLIRVTQLQEAQAHHEAMG